MCVYSDSVSDYVESTEGNVKPLLVKKGILSETEIKKLGKKDSESYPSVALKSKKRYSLPIYNAPYVCVTCTDWHITHSHIESSDCTVTVALTIVH